jgi:hypothetical protein
LALACCAIKASKAARSSAAEVGRASAAKANKQTTIARNIGFTSPGFGRNDKAVPHLSNQCQKPAERRKMMRQGKC